METINLLGFLATLGRTSLQAGVLVLVVLAAQWLLGKHLTPRWRCSLWLLVVARLLLPVSFASAVSIFNLLPHWGDRVERPLGPDTLPSPLHGAPEIAGSTPVLPAFPETVPAPTEFVRAPEVPDSLPSEPGLSTVRPLPAPPAPHPSQRVDWAMSLFWSWLVGAIAFGTYILISSLKLARSFSKRTPLNDASVLAVLADCRARMNVQTQLTLVESPAVSCPALYGLFRPRLVLPVGFARRFSARELRFIFLHELAHLKRLDLPLNWVVAVLLVIHWFNPLVWVGFARWRVDRELACDAMALDAVGVEQTHEYGQTILRLVAGFTRPASTPGLVGILESKQQLRQRISTIAAYAPARRWSLLALSTVAILGVVSLTDAKNESPNTIPAGTDRPPTEGLSAPSAGSAVRPRRSVTDGRAVKVTVLDQASGLPIVEAEVLAPNKAAFYGGTENAPLWKTDSAGSASIRLGEIPPQLASQNSWFTLSVRRAGYATRGLSWSVEKGDARAQIPAEITVRLQPGGPIGGTVQDPSGTPQASVKVRVFGCGYSYARAQERHQEYAEFCLPKNSADTMTDQDGRWSLKDFPRDLENVAVVITRANGSTHTFRHAAEEHNPITNVVGDPLDLDALRSVKAVFVLREGFSIEGTVIDPDGRAVPGALVKEGYGFGNLERGAEIRTDATGRFKLTNRAARQMILSAYAEGFAITSTIVDVGPKTPPVRLQLTRLQPLSIRVLDGKGLPIAEAKIGVLQYKTEGHVLDLEAVTGKNGIFIWSNAPNGSFALRVSSSNAPAFGNFGFNQWIKITPDQKEATFRLRKGMEKEIIVNVKARDAKGAPVVVNAVDFQNADREGFSPLGEVNKSEFQLRIPATRFRQGMEASFKLRLQAAGHEALVTDWRGFLEGDWDAEFVFTPGGNPGGTVLLPNGEPAVEARIAVMTREYVPLLIFSPDQAPKDWTQVVRADETGHFEFTYPGGDWAVVLMHNEGFLATTVDRLKSQPRIALEPWGCVEGVLHVGTNLAPRQQITLAGRHGGMNGWGFSFSTDTDDQGRFRFDQVPPIEAQLYRYFSSSSRFITPVYQMPVTAQPGKTTRVAYGGTGRPLIGRVEGDADWKNDVHLLVLKLPPAPMPEIEDFATATAFQKARDGQVIASRRKQEQEARSYQLRFEQDGSFRIDDVPAGTYELRIRVNEPKKSSDPVWAPGKEMASLTRELVVPEMAGGRSDQPLDLGVLQLQWKAQAAPKPTLDLKASTLEGKPFNLADLRGTNVVLVFWAGWSEQSTAELSQVKALYDGLRQDSRIAFWNVSLDEDVKAIRQVATSRGYAWGQTRLDSASRGKVTAEFDVNTLPSVFLVDRQGRVIGRDLRGEHLEAAIRRTLADQ